MLFVSSDGEVSQFVDVEFKHFLCRAAKGVLIVKLFQVLKVLGRMLRDFVLLLLLVLFVNLA